tara:strand:- start:5553 stop:6722 length:1170 start_codon:yes stop_codon:yes gene_type:complete
MAKEIFEASYSEYIGKKIGNIVVTDYIGEGTMGIVFKGHHKNLGIDVAIKIIKDELLSSKADEYLGRFEREARIAARLNHRCITRIIDYGFIENKPYIVIEYIDGFTLSEFIKACEDDIAEINVLKLIGMIASGLYEAHKNGIIHRDMKAQNIMISREGRPYITDLGLARDVADLTITQSSIIMGSPAYMAPENFTSEEGIDLRSDIYSLGCAAYYAAFKQLPVKGGSIKEIINKHINGDIDFGLPTNCGKETINIIKKMMNANIDERYQSAQGIVNDIKSVLANREKTAKASKDGIQKKSATASQEYYTETMEATSSVSYTDSDSLTGSNVFLNVASVLKVLEERLGPAASSHGSINITHATLKDRMILWVLLTGLFACTIIGYLLTS